MARWTFILIILCSFVMYVVSLFSPLVIIEKFYIFSETVSFLGVISGLYQEKEWLLCILVSVATLLFPLIKYTLLLTQCVSSQQDDLSKRRQLWILHLSRWSLLDVFIVAIVIVVFKLSTFSNAQSGQGLYLFMASIVLLFIVSVVMPACLKNQSNQD